MKTQTIFITFMQIFMLLLQLIVNTASENRTSRIFGGHKIDISEAKFVVQVNMKDAFHTYMCGGSLVTPIYVITAAHCVRYRRLSDIKVIGGATYYETGGVQRNVRGKYMPENRLWDIAVLRLQTPLIGPNIETIKLCHSPLQEGDIVLVYGWGESSKGDDYIPQPHPPQLQQVQLPLVDKETCALHFNCTLVPDYYFCAGVPDERAAYFGDSGGPAVLNNELCGVVSGGSDSPGIGFFVDIIYCKSFLRKYIKSPDL